MHDEITHPVGNINSPVVKERRGTRIQASIRAKLTGLTLQDKVQNFVKATGLSFAVKYEMIF